MILLKLKKKEHESSNEPSNKKDDHISHSTAKEEFQLQDESLSSGSEVGDNITDSEVEDGEIKDCEVSDLDSNFLVVICVDNIIENMK
jgi:hypothetical protein